MFFGVVKLHASLVFRRLHLPIASAHTVLRLVCSGVDQPWLRICFSTSWRLHWYIWSCWSCCLWPLDTLYFEMLHRTFGLCHCSWQRLIVRWLLLFDLIGFFLWHRIFHHVSLLRVPGRYHVAILRRNKGTLTSMVAHIHHFEV